MRAARQGREVSKSLPSHPAARLIGHEGPIHAVQFSHDGKYCLTGGYDRTIRLWNPTRIDPAAAAASSSSSTSFSSTSCAAKSNIYGTTTIPLLDIPPALPIQSYTDGHTHPISAIDIDVTSTTLLSSSDKTLVVTDVITQQLKRRYTGHHQGRINTVASGSFGGGGDNVFASGSYDGSVNLYDGRSFSSTPIQVLDDAKDSISCVYIYTDAGNGIGTSSSSSASTPSSVAQIKTGSVDGKIRTYDLRMGRILIDNFGEDTAITSLSTSSDGLCHAVSCLDGDIHILEQSSGELLNTFGGSHTAGRYSLECHIMADNKHLICGSEDGAATIYDLATGTVMQQLRGHTRPTCSVACHPNRESSSVVVTASYDGNGVVWTNGDANVISLE